MSGDRAWSPALRAACDRPEEAAAAWRADGGRVVGLLGWSAPRELVAAAGMLPVRLSPARLACRAGVGTAGDSAASAGAAFGRELTPSVARFAAALLSGALGWIDFLLIGRDREDYTRLFYLLRELRRDGAAPALVPLAFFDLLRLPSRTSARYNRQRAAELSAVIGGWAGRPVTPGDLSAAVAASTGTSGSFRRLHQLRTRRRPAVTGTDALAAAVAAQILPAARLRPLLDAAVADADVADAALAGTAPAPREVGARVFLAGSAVDDPAVYQSLEELGLAIVGEDHEWGDDGSDYPAATRDPLDGIVDRYQFGHGAAARAGLRTRVARTADRIRSAGADGVLYLLGADDAAAGWELPALREQLGHATPLVPARLRDASPRYGEPRDAGLLGTGLPDSGPPDTGLPGTGPLDAGLRDAALRLLEAVHE